MLLWLLKIRMLAKRDQSIMKNSQTNLKNQISPTINFYWRLHFMNIKNTTLIKT